MIQFFELKIAVLMINGPKPDLTNQLNVPRSNPNPLELNYNLPI